MEEHTHSYNQIVLKRITKITNDKYLGTAGDKAFLVSVCTCTHHKPLDYGPYKDMKTKLREINGSREATNLSSAKDKGSDGAINSKDSATSRDLSAATIQS